MMLGGSAFVVLGLWPAYATGQLMITDAKCLSGYEWTFNTLNQSPCDVAASLAAVCAPNGRFNLDPLPPGYMYSGPRTEFATSCRCSTVYYSLQSACGYCQSRNFIKWSLYSTNCSTVFVQSFNQPLPSGVKVPAWAYLNVLDGDTFNVTLAQQTKGTESSLPPATSSSTTSSSPLATSTKPRTNVGAIAGGVAGGVTLIIIAVVTFILLRRKRSKTTALPNIQLPENSPNSFPPTSGLNRFDDPLTWPQQSPPALSLATQFASSSGRQTMRPQEMMAQSQSDIHPTRFSMVALQNANTISTSQQTNTMVPTRMHSAQRPLYQTQNTSLPALGRNTTQNMISTLPRQNPTQNVMYTPSRHNLRQSAVSTPTEQSSTQDVKSEKMRQNTKPSAYEIPPPQYSIDPYHSSSQT